MAEKKKKQEPQVSWLLYALLAILIILYAFDNNILLGALALILILAIVALELKYSIKAEGMKKSFIDIVGAVAAAIIVWILLVIFLQTSAPVDAVSSCSMLPALHRGDLVVLHGLGNMPEFLSSHDVPVFNVSQQAFDQMQSNMPDEFLAFYAYFNGNKSLISYTIPSGAKYAVGLYSTSCLSSEEYQGQASRLAQCYVPIQDQRSNLIQYNYSIGTLTTSGVGSVPALYTSQITVGNRTISENYSDPIIVYETTSMDTFSGSIIHRLYAVLNVSGSYYFLTKGDNNQALDMEFGNYPANQSSVLGYVVADIPVVGYVKLLLSGQLLTPAGCNETLQN